MKGLELGTKEDPSQTVKKFKSILKLACLQRGEERGRGVDRIPYTLLD